MTAQVSPVTNITERAEPKDPIEPSVSGADRTEGTQIPEGSHSEPSGSHASGPDTTRDDTGTGRRGLSRLPTRLAVLRQRRVWSRRAADWDRHSSANLGGVTSAVLAVADGRSGERVVDLGCGTGQLSLPLAERGASVLAVDVSAEMTDRLMRAADQRGLRDVRCTAVPIENLRLPPRSVDLIVTSYALHHLRDADKSRVVKSAFGWLTPGGRLIVADMMLGRGASADDRAIVAAKVRALARLGPGGYWRILKNIVRYQLRVQERPVSMAAWTAMLTGAGFEGVAAQRIVAEAGLVTGVRPNSLPAPGRRRVIQGGCSATAQRTPISRSARTPVRPAAAPAYAGPVR